MDNFVPGVLYGCSMFAVGFVMGTIRTLFLVPIVGELIAVIFETPIMILLSFRMSKKYLTSSSRYHWTPVAAAIMGIAAIVSLLLLEIGMGVLLFRQPFDQIERDFRSSKGIVGLAAQIVCSSFPLLQQRQLQLGREETTGRKAQ
jgi:hypothetical protein